MFDLRRPVLQIRAFRKELFLRMPVCPAGRVHDDGHGRGVSCLSMKWSTLPLNACGTARRKASDLIEGCHRGITRERGEKCAMRPP